MEEDFEILLLLQEDNSDTEDIFFCEGMNNIECMPEQQFMEDFGSQKHCVA